MDNNNSNFISSLPTFKKIKRNYYFKSLAVILLVAVVLGACGNKDKGKDKATQSYNQTTPEKTIAYAIHLLKNKRSDEFIDKLVSPRDIGHRSKEQMNSLKKKFKESAASRMLAILLKIQNTHPSVVKINENRIGFKLKGAPDFEKLRDKWYLANNS